MKYLEEFGGEIRTIYLNGLNRRPSLSGLLSLQSAGLLFQNEPEKAYRKAVELDFFDVGYARDATALLVSIVSAALSDRKLDAREIIDIGIKTDPYKIGVSGRRIMTSIDPLFKYGHSLPRLFQAVEKAKNDRDAILALARECEHIHPFDPIDVLGVPMAIIRYTNGDPVRSILMTANHRRVDERGRLIAMRDVDCIAMITRVLVGAVNGINAFPRDWVRNVVTANMEVYGFNIEQNARKFYKIVYG